jgi:hypothetical protein
MAGRKADGIPVRLERTREQFERWRKTRRRGTRIPERLWNAAVKMAGRYGINRTASTLGIDYYSLKKRAQPAQPYKVLSRRAAKSPSRKRPASTFVEFSAVPVGTTECLIELEKASGAKMRVHLKGVAVPDVVSLSRGLWGAES